MNTVAALVAVSTALRAVRARAMATATTRTMRGASAVYSATKFS